MNEIKVNQIIQGDCLSVLKEFPDECIDCVVTSPPYWGLRDYGVSGQLGLEPTFTEYIDKLQSIFNEVKRVLKKTGTVWVNIGDSYNNTNWAKPDKFDKKSYGGKATGLDTTILGRGGQLNYQDKCLCQIPERFSLMMTDKLGFIKRNSIIWHKRNCMPSSVKDRFTVDFEYLYFYVKSKKYWFEQQLVPTLHPGGKHINKNPDSKGEQIKNTVNPTYFARNVVTGLYKNVRCVWDITTQPYKDAHFATFPEELCITPIKSGCPEFVCNKCGKARKKIVITNSKPTRPGLVTKDIDHQFATSRQRFMPEYKGEYYADCGCKGTGNKFIPGIVLDIFSGAGTTCMVAKKLNRNYIGIELNPEYIKMSEKRIELECGNLL